MGELLWFFPETEDELKSIITSEEGLVLHGGGTGLLRGDIKRYRGLVDLGKLNLSYIKEDSDFIEMGATTTYGDILRYFKSNRQNSLLYRSLENSATTPLRNRITIGGSIAYFPPWSDIMGPLLSLSCDVYISGAKEGWFSLLDYVSRKELRKNTAIMRVRYRTSRDTGYSAHFRAVRTRVDHPAFTITLLMDIREGKVHGASFYVVGVQDRFMKLNLLEKQVIGKNVSEIRTEDLRVDGVEFYGKIQFSADYQKYLFEIEARRALRKILESVE